MSGRWFVVSESELIALHSYTCDNETADEAYSNCLARPVRFIGAHGEGSSLMLWGEEEV